MNLRTFISELEKRNELIKIKKEVSTKYEMANILASLDTRPILFENVKGHNMKVAGNLNSSRDLVAEALNTKKEDLLKLMANAINKPKTPQIVKSAPCQQIIEHDVDLDRLPIMTYLPIDGGPYIPSAIIIVKDPDLGRNVCFHRLMKIGKNKLTTRVIEKRGTWTAMQKSDELEIAIAIGNSTAVQLAAATSIAPDKDEFSIANALEKTELVKCKTIDLEVPKDSEIILEGIIKKNETAKEGPFLDLTGTPDYIRDQPVIEIKCITSRKDPIFQTLLPGLMEHKILMGMPREPTIYNEVNKVCDCRNAYITPGGNSWLHAVVKIKKKNKDDGKKAIDAAFRGHTSMKHCIIVDEDIDIYDPDSVEWALATRVQADKDIILMPDQPSSSLDPTATQVKGEKAKTCKAGIDATIPFEKDTKKFKRIDYKEIDLKKYLN